MLLEEESIEFCKHGLRDNVAQLCVLQVTPPLRCVIICFVSSTLITFDFFWKFQWHVLLSADCKDKEQDIQSSRCPRYRTNNFWVLLSFTWFHFIMLSLCGSRWCILHEKNIKILKGMCSNELGWFIAVHCTHLPPLLWRCPSSKYYWRVLWS